MRLFRPFITTVMKLHLVNGSTQLENEILVCDTYIISRMILTRLLLWIMNCHYNTIWIISKLFSKSPLSNALIV